MIDTSVLNSMMQMGILAITVPVVLIAVWKMRVRKSLIPFWVGAVIFVVFARGLEMIPHTIFLLTDNPLSRLVNGNVVLFALYGGLMAGLFEETGRYVAFRFLLKKYPEKETAVTYGIGHGGAESILLLGIGYLQYYMYGQLINNGTMDKMLASYQDNPQATESLQQLVTMITGMTRTDCLIAGWERVSAMMLQIALSILVFQAVREAGKKHMLGIAILLHMLVDIPAALYQKGVLPLIPVEILFFVFSSVVLFYSIRIYNKIDFDETVETGVSPNHSLHQLANQRLRKQAEDSEGKES